MDIANSASEEFSFEKEKAIAKKYAQRFQWEMILIGVGQACIWFSLWPLVINEIIPLWSGFIIATICACFAYLPSHEAQHGNYSRGNPKRRWLDSFVGNFTLITLIYPYEVLRVTHMKHHAYTNDKETDPDFQTSNAKSIKEIILLVLDGTSQIMKNIKKYLQVIKLFKKLLIKVQK